MNCSEFFNACSTKAYIGNPELAEELYKYSKNAISEALGTKKPKDLTTELFAATIWRYWVKNGIPSENVYIMLRFLDTKWCLDNLRAEYDDFYAEMRYVDAENGGLNNIINDF